ncbi:dienelactone hydrolase family protein [Rhodococcus opacus]|uniref:Dienelactone hydrolase family protein n=2 Tax=Rhodococcus opacus TaxID=37919 RepID=A0AAX3YM45_RHOOP|nr:MULTISPECIES: dienelactone hydrolase family protein [Rhodococcus]NHU44109.1 dienelactone hydrolase family protein [Rhodococcus sp. A14]MCZ4584546.1 dienelactone hydrolase family protein [Rhodococcus opacus]MDI9938521.1 dienelactone hydrolase family protein [Rhodococcus sp. IEGM 1351]UNN01947.1 dienelactone hydrolase family protein [Rhodococcus opacus]WKN59092.1 dienelactone hydrolase family protein [Rhodococcus opacus]
MGKYIDISKSSGESFAAYLAEPAQGSGPGLVLLQEIFGINDYMRDMADRYAEEGYVVLVPDLFWRSGARQELGYDQAGFTRGLELRDELDEDLAVTDIGDTVTALRGLTNHVGGVGLIGYCLGGLLAYLSAVRFDVDCAISYYGVGVHDHLDAATELTVPVVFHLAELDSYCPEDARNSIRKAFDDNDQVRIYDYPGVDHAFATHGRDVFEPLSAGLAYSRTLEVLHATIGPRYDLSALWDRHIYYEFEARDVPATMATMVDEPYVNHIPTLTGGVGQKDLSRFYAHHFVHNNPADTKTIPISRTVGADRIVDEQLFCFTHDREIDWMLPGVAPTGRYVEIPLVAVVTLRGDKLYNEHIYWDQAGVLVQIGLLDPDGLPVAGIAQGRKLLDKALPSNELMPSWASSEGRPID